MHTPLLRDFSSPAQPTCHDGIVPVQLCDQRQLRVMRHLKALGTSQAVQGAVAARSLHQQRAQLHVLLTAGLGGGSLGSIWVGQRGAVSSVTRCVASSGQCTHCRVEAVMLLPSPRA
jgi:hypothetical protein